MAKRPGKREKEKKRNAKTWDYCPRKRGNTCFSDNLRQHRSLRSSSVLKKRREEREGSEDGARAVQEFNVFFSSWSGSSIAQSYTRRKPEDNRVCEFEDNGECELTVVENSHPLLSSPSHRAIASCG